MCLCAVCLSVCDCVCSTSWVRGKVWGWRGPAREEGHRSQRRYSLLCFKPRGGEQVPSHADEAVLAELLRTPPRDSGLLGK